MMWLLHEHHILPGQYYSLPEGEKQLLYLMKQWENDLRNQL